MQLLRHACLFPSSYAILQRRTMLRCACDSPVTSRTPALSPQQLLLPQAGLLISGINAEVMPGQWEFQIGPVGPLEVGDQVCLLHQLC